MACFRSASCVPLFGLMALGCADDGKGDGGRDGRAGSSGTGGLTPIDPGGSMPNCAADEPSIVPVKDRRWMYFDARQTVDGPVGRYLVEITPDGPEGLTLVAENARTLTDSMTPGSFSADGRYFAFTRSDEAGWLSIDLFEVSEGTPPVPVQVPHQLGEVHWSPADARFYVLSPTTLSLTDVTNGTERTIELPGTIHFDSWSPDGRYLALSGDGITLIDTSGPELVALPIPDSRAQGAPEWSPGSRHIAFQSGYDVAYYDIEADRVEVVSPFGDFSRWIGDGLLLFLADTRAYVLDVTEDPPRPVALRGEHRHLGVVSPGGKCIQYDGYCGRQVSEYGLCVRTLPPDPSVTPVRIHDDGDIVAGWSGTGDHFAFSLPSADGRALVHVPLDGSELTREFILEPSHSQQVLGRWNPSGESNWFGYLDESLGANGRTELHLWHRETRQTIVVGGSGRSARGHAWSQDGRHIALELAADWNDQEPVLEIHEILEDRLGRSFTIEGLFPASDRWERPWQP